MGCRSLSIQSRQSQAGVSAALRLGPPLPTKVPENVSPPARAVGQLHQRRLETWGEKCLPGPPLWKFRTTRSGIKLRDLHLKMSPEGVTSSQVWKPGLYPGRGPGPSWKSPSTSVSPSVHRGGRARPRALRGGESHRTEAWKALGSAWLLAGSCRVHLEAVWPMESPRGAFTEGHFNVMLYNLHIHCICSFICIKCVIAAQSLMGGGRDFDLESERPVLSSVRLLAAPTSRVMAPL